jgi:hypothetical protein
MVPISVDPMVPPERPQADFSCCSATPVETVRPGPEPVTGPAETPPTFGVLIEEVLRESQATDREQPTQGAEPLLPSVVPVQLGAQDAVVSLLPSTRTEGAERLEHENTDAAPVPTLVPGGPRTGPAFPARMPVPLSGAAEAGSAEALPLPGDAAREGSANSGSKTPPSPPGLSSPSGSAPSCDRGFIVSLLMTHEAPRQGNSAGLEPPKTDTAGSSAEECNQPRPAEGGTSGSQAPAAVSAKGETSTAVLAASVANGKNSDERQDIARSPQSRTRLPNERPATTRELASRSASAETTDKQQSSQLGDQPVPVQGSADAGPSGPALPPPHGQDRDVSRTAPPGTEGPDTAVQTGGKPADARPDATAGTGRSAPTPGLSRNDSVASHLHIQAREALDGSAKQFHLRIQGDGLGEMRWDVRLEPGKIAAHARVDTIQLQELLRGQQDALVQRFQELGLKVESFEVLVDSGSTGERFQGWGASGSGGNPRKGAAPPEERSLANAASGMTDRTLDLFV